MALYPALPLFTDAYLADTRHLTTEEHGAYLLLLMCAWRCTGCVLEDNDKTLARIAGLSPTKWRRLKPVIVQFFTIEGGVWKQKKLQAVYSDVASRVARNKANGARGGRARAAMVSKGVAGAAATHSNAVCGKETGKRAANNQATKTKTKQKQPPAADKVDKDSQAVKSANSREDHALWREQIIAACPDGTAFDDSVIHLWCAAGVDLERDALPTIEAVAAREVNRTGRPPHSLGYFREVVLETSSERQKAEQAGKCLKPAPKLPQAGKKDFDPADAEHWQNLLGDPDNRYRGDYLARNWFIPTDHPVFRERGLGINPRLSVTDHIPGPVRDRYGKAWAWL